MRVVAIAAVVSVAVASCGGRTTAPPSAAANQPVPEGGTGAVQEPVPLAIAGATNDAGDASTATAEPEADRDGDGVPDKADRCPDRPGSSFSDGHGCPMGGGPDYKISCGIAAFVTFWHGSTRLTPDSDAAIREVADLMKANPCLKVEVIGYVSSDEVEGMGGLVGEGFGGEGLGGVKLKNPEKTGTARAAAVIEVVIRAGVDRTRLVAKYGGPLPAPFGAGASRVEFHMMNRGAACKVIGCPPD